MNFPLHGVHKHGTIGFIHYRLPKGRVYFESGNTSKPKESIVFAKDVKVVENDNPAYELLPSHRLARLGDEYGMNDRWITIISETTLYQVHEFIGLPVRRLRGLR